MFFINQVFSAQFEFLILCKMNMYCMVSSSSIRDNRSRIVSLQFRLSGLRLSARARDKFLRLVGESERYDYTTDIVTISSDRLPHRKQNRQYCEYLIKVIQLKPLISTWKLVSRLKLDNIQTRQKSALRAKSHGIARFLETYPISSAHWTRPQRPTSRS